MRPKQVAAGIVAVLVVLSWGATSAATSSAPGTAARVRQLVKDSHTIVKVNAAVAASLTGPRDTPERLYPGVASGCNTVTQCVFGSTKARRTVVLFGDSHALMWLPAMDLALRALGYRLVVLWASACPAAMVTSYRYLEGVQVNYAKCTSWKATQIAAIHKLRPTAVLVGERTAAIVHTDGTSFTRTQWQTALTSTLHQLHAPGTKVGVLQDIVYFDNRVPACLAAYPKQVQQQCAVPNPNPKHKGQQAAEQAAAKATGSYFVKTLQWLCTTHCSPIVGNTVTYYDEGHVSATYAEYLSGVLKSALKSVLQ